MVEMYRKFRQNKAGYFILKGDNSSREFRGEMKDIGGEYLSGGRYIVKMDHINKFDKNNLSY